jgi:hypothetical protein
MNRKLMTILLAGSFLAWQAFPLAVQARVGSEGQERSRQYQNRQRLLDGSCLNQNPFQTGPKNKKGNTNRPGDGPGNTDQGPKDGTGSGTPSQK